MTEDAAAAMIMLFILAFVAFLVWNKHKVRMDKQRMLLEAQTRILERIGTGDALTAFLQTEEGRALLQSHEKTEETEKPWRSYRGIRMSIIGLLTSGVICIGIGAGFYYAALRVEPDLMIPAGIVAGVGAGCIVAALIHYILGKAWGLLDGNGQQDRSRQRPL
jgi:hypothetical protein